MNIEKVKSRIAKILAKANNNSNEFEAAIAAEKARKLMDQYQLTELDITDINQKAKAIRAAHGKDYAYMPVWLDILAVAVGKYNDCWVSRSGIKHDNSTRYRIVFSGLESDIHLATTMWDYLSDRVTALCKDYMASLGYTRYVASVGDAFKRACSNTLCNRLAKMTAERTKITTATGTSLVVIKQDILIETFGEPPKYKESTVIPDAVDPKIMNAVIAGKREGDKVEIVRAVEC